MDAADSENKKLLDQALSAGDDWLRKQGVVTDFSINTILAWIYLNFEKVENVEMDVDRPKQRIFVRVYLRFWTLFLLFLFRNQDRLIDAIFVWLSEYLPTYEISVELKRFRGPSRVKFTIQDETPMVEEEPLEGNLLQALKDAKTPKAD